jgi:hypothetical protein
MGKKRPPNDLADAFYMENNFGESWRDCDCSFCKKYGDNFCRKCPIYRSVGSCSGGNKQNLWGSLYKAENWGDWVIAEEAFIKQMKKIFKVK